MRATPPVAMGSGLNVRRCLACRPQSSVCCWAWLSGKQFAVAHMGGPLAAKLLRQLLRHVHRTVLPAGATNGHRDIAALIGLHGWQPTLQVAAKVVQHV